MCDTHEVGGYPRISPEMCPNIEDVHIALVVLHHHPDKMEKKGASTWLSNVQSSVHAWDLSLNILHENRDLESAFFGAQTIRLKIQTSFHELSSEQRLQIRNKLLNHLKTVDGQSNVIVVKRLCLALADLAFKLPSWPNPIDEIINELSSYNIVPLLDVLKAIPEEVLTTPLEHSRNLEVNDYLRRSSNTVSKLLDGILTHYQGQVTIDVLTLRCLTSWIPVHCLHDLMETYVCNYAFQSMMAVGIVPDEIHEAASSFISTLLDSLKATPMLSQLGSQILRKVKLFQEPYHLAVAHEDHHKVLSYSKIFTEAAECFLPEIVAASTRGQAHYSMEVFDLVLQCVGHHDYEVADRTFDLWFTLSEQVNEEMGMNPGMVTVFSPYIERLIVALCNNCQMEPDQADLLEDGDEFQDFRTRAFALVQEVVFIAGADRCFQQFLEQMLQLHGETIPWEAYEATLFIMSAFASKVDTFEEPMMRQIFETIMKFAQDNSHIAIRNTILLLLGEFTHVISVHRDYLAIAINHIIGNLNDPLLAPQSAASLRAICLWSPNNIIVHLVTLFQLTSSLDSYPIPNDGALDLLKGVASVLKVLDTPRLEIALKHLCWPQVARLSDIVHGDLPIIINTRTDPVVFLDRLTTLFKCASPSKYVDSKHPFLPMFEGILPVLLLACNKYKTDTRILKRCCRTVRFGLKAMGKQSTELVGPVQKVLLGILADYHYKCLFKLSLTLVELYLEQPSCVDELHDLLRKLTEPTIDHLLRGQDNFVEEVFQVIRIFTRDSPTSFLQRTFTEQIIHSAIIALTHDPLCVTARRCSLRFFNDVVHSAIINQSAVDYFLRRQLVEQIIVKYGKPLMMALLCVIVEDHSLIVLVSHVIWNLRNFNDLLATQYLKAAIEALPSMQPGGTPVIASEAPLSLLYEDITGTGSIEGISRVLERISCLFTEKTS